MVVFLAIQDPVYSHKWPFEGTDKTTLNNFIFFIEFLIYLPQTKTDPPLNLTVFFDFLLSVCLVVYGRIFLLSVCLVVYGQKTTIWIVQIHHSLVAPDHYPFMWCKVFIPLCKQQPSMPLNLLHERFVRWSSTI